ncbi:nitrate regulatory gene2 protein-like isoform X2 [Pistacia vera]|uniref:nitrate regulatory gene2 protein-like isoform X2 n=2 Tax=Pistacia vera TaxID=55513 RepID=UPI0012631054|nr:nitrate regulatory gene2 protein-like isoform X2 [Pistacia vera]
MGCNTSKLDGLPAVALCRDRCNFLEDALYHSYALADAHVAYMQSLKTLGSTLHQFIDHQDVNFPSNDDPAKSSKSSPPDLSPSSLTSDSHIHFDSDSEDEDRIKDFDSFNHNHSNYFNTFMAMNYNDNSRSYRHNGEMSGRDWASKTPPPPTPSGSAWDFLNFFEPLEKYENPYGVTRDPQQDKETDEKKQEHEHISAGNDNVVPTLVKEKGDDVEKKKVVSEKERSVEPESKSSGQNGQWGVSEVMRDVQVQFERASESGNEVLKMFDTGKFRYHHKFSVYGQVSSKMLHAVSPSRMVVSTHFNYQGLEDDVVLNSKNLTATLKKLCMWERKLYDEVKAEEKLRLLYARKCRQMKSMDEKGAETLKVDAARTMLRNLSTRIKIAIQVIDKMSISINKLRDEELWLHIRELVQRLLEMWKAMLECHRCQSQTVLEAKGLDVIASNAKLDHAHLESAIKLKLELQNCNLNFSNWIEAQKSYVKALNGWLMKCLRYDPEVTPDGIVPFSPGRVGAPPVFVIAYQWSQAMDKLSEKEVTEAIYGFSASVNQLLERHKADLQQMVIANKDVERQVKTSEREEQKIQKVIQARDKRMILLAREGSGSMQSGLKQIFMAIEKFAANSKQAYDELHVRIEERRSVK